MSKVQEFSLEEKHILLLQNAYWEQQDSYSGSPAMNDKRPYGNSGHYAIARDMYFILRGKEPDVCDDSEEEEEFINDMLHLHSQLYIALEIILSLRTFEVGLYGYDDEKGWYKI